MDPSLIHRLFYPQVPLVLASQLGGRVSAMPVVSYASVSDKPPMVAVSCAPGAFTCELTRRAKSFSLSALDRPYANAISVLATASGAKVKDKLAEAGLKHARGSALEVPRIRGAAATLECRLISSGIIGDHRLLVGKVEAAYASEAFRGYWDFSKYRPVLYTGWKDGLTTYPAG